MWCTVHLLPGSVFCVWWTLHFWSADWNDSVWGFRWGKSWVGKSLSRAAQLGQTDVCSWHGFAWQTLGIEEGQKKKKSTHVYSWSQSRFSWPLAEVPLGGLCRNRTCFPVREAGLLLLVLELQLVASITSLMINLTEELPIFSLDKPLWIKSSFSCLTSVDKVIVFNCSLRSEIF